ncbi:MAG: hypothetical protein LBV44_08210 [Methylobacillus sp.]|jgi:type IV pilus assembly protein PilC|nr:hypothetical protein [Methylobacillus sp.]
MVETVGGGSNPAPRFFPTLIVMLACSIPALVMIFVIPVFKPALADFGAYLPASTLTVLALSDLCVKFRWFAIPGILGLSILFLLCVWLLKCSSRMQYTLALMILGVSVAASAALIGTMYLPVYEMNQPIS